jgi:predicted aldo/keto reductase-like oxidoreductase
MVMEPVKGGTLAQIPEEAEAKLRTVHPDWTPADWALRFVRSLPDVEIVLSGMGAVEQVEANMRPCDPLTEQEIALLAEVAEIIRGKTAIGCTGCAYCVPHCPRKIPIPQYIKLYNELCRTPKDDWKMVPTYHQMAITNGKASDCISCRACEGHCPQKLQISDHMKSIAARFEQGECV